MRFSQRNCLTSIFHNFFVILRFLAVIYLLCYNYLKIIELVYRFFQIYFTDYSFLRKHSIINEADLVDFLFSWLFSMINVLILIIFLMITCAFKNDNF